MQNSLHPLSTSSFIARHLLHFMLQMADAPTIRLDATPSGLSVPPPLHRPHIFTPNALSAAALPICPGLGKAPNNAAGLHTWRLD